VRAAEVTPGTPRNDASRDAWPSGTRGSLSLVRTRVPAWTLERYRRLEWTEAQILDNFPTLRAADLVNVWAYVDAHVEEIEAAIRENDEA
jgi:uncharacterized protein (DUF433 family)